MGGGWIVTVRHGRPDLARTGRFDAAGWDRWWAEYDRTGLAPDQRPLSRRLRRLAANADILVSSTLPRARETAQALADGRMAEADPLFVEAPLPAPPLPGFLQFSPRTWSAISRLAWLWGYAGSGESRAEAELRARKAADALIALAEREGNVLLCAHGWFNRMIGRELRARGWRRAYNGGDHYWSHRQYMPPSEKARWLNHDGKRQKGG